MDSSRGLTGKNLIELTDDWSSWKASDPVELIRPVENWEGGNLEAIPSVRGPTYEKVCQLRDPAIYEEESKVYLLYAIAGESGIAIAELVL